LVLLGHVSVVIGAGAPDDGRTTAIPSPHPEATPMMIRVGECIAQGGDDGTTTAADFVRFLARLRRGPRISPRGAKLLAMHGT
jgi:hypothetical protein